MGFLQVALERRLLLGQAIALALELAAFAFQVVGSLLGSLLELVDLRLFVRLTDVELVVELLQLDGRLGQFGVLGVDRLLHLFQQRAIKAIHVGITGAVLLHVGLKGRTGDGLDLFRLRHADQSFQLVGIVLILGRQPGGLGQVGRGGCRLCGGFFVLPEEQIGRHAQDNGEHDEDDQADLKTLIFAGHDELLLAAWFCKTEAHGRRPEKRPFEALRGSSFRRYHKDLR